MEARTFPVNGKLAVQGPFIRVEEKACPCGCSPPRFITVGNGKLGISLVLTAKEFEVIRMAFVQPTVSLTLAPKDKHYNQKEAQ